MNNHESPSIAQELIVGDVQPLRSSALEQLRTQHQAVFLGPNGPTNGPTNGPPGTIHYMCRILGVAVMKLLVSFHNIR